MSWSQINKFYSMQGETWKRSRNPLDLNINEVTIDTIKNSLLEYKAKSEFYLDIPQKSQLTLILFLCLFSSKRIQSKKVDALMNKVDKAFLQELKDQYFDSFRDEEQLHIPQIFKRASAKFNYHERMIENLSQIFEKAASLGILFENAYYKNKVQIRQFKNGVLIPFKNTSFKFQQGQPRNDIIVIPYQTGYYIACFSTKDHVQAKEEEKEQDIKIQKKAQLKQQQVQEIKVEASIDRKKVENDVDNSIAQKRLEQINELKQKDEKDKVQQPLNEDQQFQKGTFIILVIILIVCLAEAYFQVISNTIITLK